MTEKRRGDTEGASFKEFLEGLVPDGIQDFSLYREAFTHRSYAQENKDRGTKDNERLEFIGDAVVKLVISEELYNIFKDSDEGALSRMRSYVVSGKALAKASRRLGLGEYLLLGKGAEKTGERNRSSILADLFEAMVGAVFFDKGFEAARLFVKTHLTDELTEVVEGRDPVNYKNILQEHLQMISHKTPVYRVIEEIGPMHAREYVVEVEVDGKVLSVGRGKNKKSAEQDGAMKAIKSLGVDPLNNKNIG